MGAVDSMRRLVKSLPKGDVNLAHSFLDSRDFESLHDLVSSAIHRVNKGLKSEAPKQEYLDADITEMSIFKSEISSYMDQLNTMSDYEKEY